MSTSMILSRIPGRDCSRARRAKSQWAGRVVAAPMMAPSMFTFSVVRPNKG